MPTTNPATARNPAPLERLDILLVEPSPTQARIIVGQLRTLGIARLRTARTGAEARAAALADPPDVVVSAMYLEDMTAGSLIRDLHETPQTRDVAFMLASSETGFDALEPVRQAGANALLPKPFTSVQLASALAVCLDALDPNRLDLGDFHPEELDVLVVDDSALARKAIARTLRGMGIEKITEAADGDEAIPLIERTFFDLVVTDYNMPTVDGCQLIEHVRRDSSQCSVPILMVTTEGDLGKLAAVERAGVSAICDKPFEPATIKALIERLVTGI